MDLSRIVEFRPRLDAATVPGLRPGPAPFMLDEIAVDLVRDRMGYRKWLCPKCGRAVRYIYLDQFLCQACSGLDWAVRHGITRQLPVIARIRRLRHKIGAPLAPFTKISRPRRARHRFADTVRQIRAKEAVLLAQLQADTDRLERNLRRKSAARAAAAVEKA